MLGLDESKDKQLSEDKIQEKSSTEHESSERFSKMAVLDNMNLKPEGVSHRRVKGFRIRDKDDELRQNIKLTEDIIFQGLSSEELLRQYQSAQKFNYSFEIIRYLTDDSLKYMDALNLNDASAVKRYLSSRGFINFEKF